MSNFYAACHLGENLCRVMLGTLHNGNLTMSEIHKFENQPVHEGNSITWNIPQLYQETLDGLRQIGNYEEPVASISCSGWAADYLLLEKSGALISPTYHHEDSRSKQGREAVLAKIPWEVIYDETGTQHTPVTTLCQLGVERSRRIKRADHLMPIADGFNFLLSGLPFVEMSSASTTQLYNPLSQNWSERLLESIGLAECKLPRIVPAGTEIGPLRSEVAEATNLTGAQIIASYSHELPASIMGLPVSGGERCAYLNLGSWSAIGMPVARPMINEETRELGFSNQSCFGGVSAFHKHAMGFWILEQCRCHWKERDRELDADVLTHLAACSEPFESLINPSDPRFVEPADMPLKIQEFCRETGQPVPRKPGSIVRCVLESVALHYRRIVHEIMDVSGCEISQLYILGNTSNKLLNHFIANALEMPVFIASPESAAIGNVLVQSLAQGHVESLDEAREIARRSCILESIVPRAGVWHEACNRFAGLDLHSLVAG